MSNHFLISDSELSHFMEKPLKTSSDNLVALYQQQLTTWSLLATNVSMLRDVVIKKFSLGGFKVTIQHNPNRITSTSAIVDPDFIQKRKCFLCGESLPKEQKGFMFDNGFVALCNPFPIFPFHFTIPHIKHQPQQITSSIGEMISLVEVIKGDYVLFYNGPQCGASAPDHLHFQMVKKEFLPLINQICSLQIKPDSKLLIDKVEFQKFSSLPVKFISIKSTNSGALLNSWKIIFQQLKTHDKAEEPLLNILAYYDKEHFNIIIIPRSVHRPFQYFLENEDRLLISPASIDMCGLLVVPRKKDFDKITADLIENIYHQVSIDKESLENLFNRIKAF